MNASYPPYLSFVTTSRNDGTGPDSIARLQLFVDSLRTQAQACGLRAELILVEWNPPADRPRLRELIRWPSGLSSCAVRIIEVPAEVHSRFANSEQISLFQMIAKNTGIRRARGRFVLATNIDILFSNELIGFFATESLDANRMYRIDRHDVSFEVSGSMSLDERLESYRQHVLRVYRYMETVEAMDGVIPPPKPTQSSLLKRMFGQLLRRDKPLHTNTCGDFTLLSADYWQKLGGYPEFPLRAMKLDGLLCYAAHSAGARELVLQEPMRIYHLDHPARSDGALIALSSRQNDSSSLQLPLSQYQAWTKQMRRSRSPILFNKAGWGLAGEELNETIIN